MKVLVIGGGGREHALCWRLARCPSVSEVLCAPGNAGIASIARCLPIEAGAIDTLVEAARAEQVDLVVVGPEAPLVAGIADRLREAGIPVFGPDAAAAQLEGSKAFAKALMTEAGVPTARFVTTTSMAQAEQTIREWGAPIVVKASGLAAGKGVVVAENEATALEAARAMLTEARFGDAGREVVIEECLQGEEASLFFIISGETVIPLASSQDHKRLGDGDTGPNTGGMGAYSPAPCIPDALLAEAEVTIVTPLLAALARRGIDFIGVLFVGVMVTDDGLKVLEFNVRFGDPECQALMCRMEGDLARLLLAAAEGRLAEAEPPRWRADAALCVVVASDGYPGSYRKGEEIAGLDAVERTGAVVFHAGTARDAQGRLVNSGGRVLGVTTTAPTIAAAQQKAYAALKELRWPGGIYRRDIGWRAVAREQQA
ncbi:MAG: phosphoribosylamine--glycine ligase [Zetaproteobacteria bacterium]|nr:MAG: phosphoribosylamine--glycine ligase [Zetaproteobacteria bacterium]